MEFLAGLLIGSWFWPIAFAAFIGLIFAVENESNALGYLVTAIAAVALFFYGGESIASTINWIIANPFWVVGAVAAYYATGALYAVAKWHFFTNSSEIQARIKESFKKFVEEKQSTYINGFVGSRYLPSELARNSLQFEEKKLSPEFEKFQKAFVEPTVEEFKFSSRNPVLVSGNRSRIMCWISFWFVSLFWTVTHDLFKGIARRIYNTFSTLYAKIASNSIDKAFTK